MTINGISKYFKRGNVCVFGLRGCGKDVLFGNVIARRKNEYVSNLDYTNDSLFHPLSLGELDCGKNSYTNFIEGRINRFVWKYPHDTDVYISDSGIYFPSQYCGELNQRYKYLPTYFALSRQVSHNNVHVNSQALGRTWDKIREQSDTFILCRWCKHIGNLFFIGVTIYDRYDSAVSKQRPFSLKPGWFNGSQARMMYKIERDKFVQKYGDIHDKILIFINRSKHDTYHFEKLLANGKDNNEKNN